MQDISLMVSFWNGVAYVLKLMGPLVKVVRLVDNEKKLAMGYIHKAMDRSKEAFRNFLIVMKASIRTCLRLLTKGGRSSFTYSYILTHTF